MTPKSRIRTDGFAILGGDTKGRGDASTSPAVDAHPKEVNAVTNSSKSSPTVSPEPINTHEQALARAMDVLRDNTLVGADPFTPAYWQDITREVVEAYLAALPSDEAAFTAALDTLTHRSEVASIWYPEETSRLRRVEERQNARDNVVELYRQAKGGA